MDTDSEDVFEENYINRAAQISRRTERLGTGKDNTNQQQSIGNSEVDRIISNIVSLQDDSIHGYAPRTDSTKV